MRKGNPLSYSTQMLRSFYSTEKKRDREERTFWHSFSDENKRLNAGLQLKMVKICMTQHLCKQFMSKYFIYSDEENRTNEFHTKLNENESNFNFNKWPQ